MHKTDRIVAIILAALSIALFIYSSQAFPLGSDTYPKGLSVSLGILSLLLLVSSISKGQDCAKDAKENVFPEREGLRLVMFCGSFTILYVFLIDILGYYIVTPIFLYACLHVLGERRITVLLTTSLGFTLLVNLFFGVFMKIRMPHGILF